MEKNWQVVRPGLQIGETLFPAFQFPPPHYDPRPPPSCRLDVQFSRRMMKLAKQMRWERRNRDWKGRGGGRGGVGGER